MVFSRSITYMFCIYKICKIYICQTNTHPGLLLIYIYIYIYITILPDVD